MTIQQFLKIFGFQSFHSQNVTKSKFCKDLRDAIIHNIFNILLKNDLVTVKNNCLNIFRLSLTVDSFDIFVTFTLIIFSLHCRTPTFSIRLSKTATFGVRLFEIAQFFKCVSDIRVSIHFGLRHTVTSNPNSNSLLL